MRFIRFVRDLFALIHTVLLRVPRAATVSIVILCAVAVPSTAMAQSVVEIRVDANDGVATPSGPNPGHSWGNAYLYLQDAINQANTLLSGQNPPSTVELWVANGTYYPDITAATASTGGTNLRAATFKMENNIKILGGFAGGATNETHKNQRNPLVNITILSGDIQQNDPGTITDNSYHVVTGELLDVSAIIDGFTITAGNALGASVPVCGGITCSQPSGCDYGLDNGEVGGGMILLGVQTLEGCGACLPLVMRCRFEGNQAKSGGGVFYSANQFSNPIFGNCQFIDNTATAGAGGGARLGSGVQGCNATLVNCLTCPMADPPIEGAATIRNSIVFGNDGLQLFGPNHVDYSCIEDLGEVCENGTHNNNHDDDPVFVSASDFHLSGSSPYLNAGLNSSVVNEDDPADINQNGQTGDPMPELDGRLRISTPTNTANCLVDLGAYEFQAPGCPGDVAPVPGGNGIVDVDDLIAVILDWGACPSPPAVCWSDTAPGGPCGNGQVDVDDLIAVILHWGECPGVAPGETGGGADPESYQDCENLCEGKEGEEWFTCMQSCFWYLCTEKNMTEFCE